MYATLKNYQIQLGRKMKNKSPVQLVLKSMICTNDERIRLKKNQIVYFEIPIRFMEKKFWISNFIKLL